MSVVTETHEAGSPESRMRISLVGEKATLREVLEVRLIGVFLSLSLTWDKGVDSSASTSIGVESECRDVGGGE